MTLSSQRTLHAVLVVLAVGVALRFWQWYARTSMWLDEIWLAQNFRDRGLGELLATPLSSRQMAPPGFLLSVEATTSVLGLGEATLRFVPFVAGVLALVLVWRVGARFVDGAPLIGVLLLTAVSPALIWYSGNVKQYSSDVACALLLTLLALRFLENPEDTRRATGAALLGGIAILFSHAAVLTGAVLGLTLLIHRVRAESRATWRPFVLMSAGWGVAAAITTWLTLSFSSPEVRAHMRDFWAEGFLPWSDGLVAVFVWVPARLYHTLAHYIVFLDADFGVLAAPLALLVVVGIVPLSRRHGIRGVVLLAPVIAGLLGGAVGLLPLRNRLSIHAGAALVLVGMVGLQHFLRAEGRWTRRAGWVVGVLAILPMPLIVATTSRPPLRAPETRPVLEMLGERVGPAERVIAYCWAAPAAEYYGPAAAVSVDRVVECAESESDAVAAARSIEAGRVWFFHTDTPEPRWSAEFMVELESRGEEVDRIVDPHAGLRPGTEAVLYEIGSGS